MESFCSTDSACFPHPLEPAVRNFSRWDSGEIIQVIVKCEDVLDPATFRKIDHIVSETEKIKGIRRIISLKEIKNAIDKSGTQSMAEFAAKIAPVDLFKRNLISEDRNCTALTLLLFISFPNTSSKFPERVAEDQQ